MKKIVCWMFKRYYQKRRSDLVASLGYDFTENTNHKCLHCANWEEKKTNEVKCLVWPRYLEHGNCWFPANMQACQYFKPSPKRRGLFNNPNKQ